MNEDNPPVLEQDSILRLHEKRSDMQFTVTTNTKPSAMLQRNTNQHGNELLVTADGDGFVGFFHPFTVAVRE